jgi:hypothetical protein
MADTSSHAGWTVVSNQTRRVWLLVYTRGSTPGRIQGTIVIAKCTGLIRDHEELKQFSQEAQARIKLIQELRGA